MEGIGSEHRLALVRRNQIAIGRVCRTVRNAAYSRRASGITRIGSALGTDLGATATAIRIGAEIGQAARPNGRLTVSKVTHTYSKRKFMLEKKTKMKWRRKNNCRGTSITGANSSDAGGAIGLGE